MTLDEKIQQAASDWQINGCIKSSKIIENARTRWASIDFAEGANFTKSELMPLLEKALFALDETRFQFKRSFFDAKKAGPFADIYQLNEQTAQEIRERLK